MNGFELNWWAILVAGVVGIATGAIWFGPRTFYPIWWKALGKEMVKADDHDDNMAVVFGMTFLGAFAQAFGLAVIFEWIRPESVLGGALLGTFVGIVFAAAPSLGHRLFGRQGFKVWIIEVAADIVGLALMGAILAGWQ